MRGAFVGIVGLFVILSASAALVSFELRPGPHEVLMDSTPVPIVMTVDSETTGVPIVCVTAPCDSLFQQTLAIRVEGLPDGDYTLRLLGGPRVIDLQVPSEGGVLAETWQGEGNEAASIDTLALWLGIMPLSEIPVVANERSAMDAPVEFPIGGFVHLNQIGAFEVSLVAKGEIYLPSGVAASVDLFMQSDAKDTLLARGIALDGARTEFSERIERVEIPRQGTLQLRWGSVVVAQGSFLG